MNKDWTFTACDICDFETWCTPVGNIGTVKCHMCRKRGARVAMRMDAIYQARRAADLAAISAELDAFMGARPTL